MMKLVQLLWVQRFAAGDVRCIFILRITSFSGRTPVVGMKQDGLMEVLLREYSDSHKYCGLEIVRGVPLCGMDRIKRHILIHPSCPVSAIMDKKNKGPMVIMVNQEWHCSHQVAFADLEDSGLLNLNS